MATVTIDDSSLSAIAGAIRGKLDVETTYKPSEMAAAIGSIDTSGTELTSADAGKVVVESSGDYVLAAQTSRSISQNGTYDTTTNDSVTVSVSGGGQPTSENDLLFHFDSDMRNSGKTPAIIADSTRLSISDEQSKFGASSLKIESEHPTYRQFIANAGFSFGNDDFTVDAWAYPTYIGSNNCVFSFPFRSLAFYLLSDTSINLGISFSGSSWDIGIQANVSNMLGAWHHYAICRDGSTVRAFIDGSTIITSNIGNNSINDLPSVSERMVSYAIPFGFGTNLNNSNTFQGYIDEFRVKLGEAVWTDDFTPPTQPYA